jgi:hypothetical protein
MNQFPSCDSGVNQKFEGVSKNKSVDFPQYFETAFRKMFPLAKISRHS